jgi:hypothetical protein
VAAGQIDWMFRQLQRARRSVREWIEVVMLPARPTDDDQRLDVRCAQV